MLSHLRDSILIMEHSKASSFTVAALLLQSAIIQPSLQLNFLFIPAPGEHSHRRSMLPAAEALGRRGHNVTIWTPIPEEESSASGSAIVEDLMPVVHPASDDAASASADSELYVAVWHMEGSKPSQMHLSWLMWAPYCDASITEHFDDLIKMSKRKWDLIVHCVFSPCTPVIAKYSDAPMVAWSTALPLPQLVRSRMLPFNPSYVPQLDILPEEVPLHNSVFSRLKNFLSLVGFTLSEVYTDRFIIQSSLVANHWPQFTFNEFEKDAVFAIAQHPLDFDFASPLLPDFARLTENCRKPKELSEEWKQFLDNPASKGTVVVAFGHFVRWDSAPAASYASFANALARLSRDGYRIVWHCNLAEADFDSRNPSIRKTEWMPQSDILHHSKTKLFVTHGGLKSMMESICAGVPMVPMPFFAEQYRNTALLTQKRMGIFLDKFNLSSDRIYATLTAVLNNASYAENTKRMTAVINDKLIPAESYNSFLLEFAARHGRNLHRLRHKGMTHLNLAQFYALDVIAFLLLAFFISCYLLYQIIYNVWRIVVSK